jgi:DNA processing protein
VNGPTVTAMPGGLDVCYPATRRSLCVRVREKGCAISELPCGSSPRRWSQAARTRIVVGAAQLVIVVEAEDNPPALHAAHLAQELGRTVAAVPGRVSSPVSRGPHALLAAGAQLVTNPQDALDALYGAGLRQAPAAPVPAEPRLRAVLEQVGTGHDTLARLTATGAQPQNTLVALADLELAGALVRGDGGRYLRCG